jgi:hypothetical protein
MRFKGQSPAGVLTDSYPEVGRFLPGRTYGTIAWHRRPHGHLRWPLNTPLAARDARDPAVMQDWICPIAQRKR